METNMIKEDGEPTNSISAGSMDSHDASDGKRKKEKTKIARRKKMTKYQEYKESLSEDHSEEMDWFEYEYDDLTILNKNVVNLNIPPTDYIIYPEQGYAEFRYYSDIEAIEKLTNDPHNIVPHKPYKNNHPEEDEIETTYYNDATGGD